MSQFFLSLPHDSEVEPTVDSMDAAELEQIMADVEAFNAALVEAGAFVTAGGLMPPSTAVTVNGEGGGLTRTEGPFVKAAEYLGGFWVVEAPDLEAAIRWAEQAAAALRTRVEVRALQEAPAE